jgi:hypothetical protein
MLLGAAGCDRVFQLLEVGEPDLADAASDGSDPSCVSDDFNGSAVDETKWMKSDAAPVATVEQADGNLVLKLGQATGNNYALLASASRDFTNDAVSVELVGVPASASAAEAGFSIEQDITHRYQMFVAGPNLIMRVSTPTDGNLNMSIPYSATNHRFMRIRHANDMMLWETSPDGSTWTTRRLTAVLTPLTDLHLEIFAGTFQLEAVPPGEARFNAAAIECLP